jgi:hypothetical protein
MKRYAKAVVAIAFLLALSGAVKAESQDGVTVEVPFQFVVSGQTLPAGTYTVRQLSKDSSGLLTLTNKEDLTSVVVLPYASNDALVDQPQVSFEQAGGQSFLRAIQTPLKVYQIHVSQSAIRAAVAKSRNSGAVAGISGGN